MWIRLISSIHYFTFAYVLVCIFTTKKFALSCSAGRGLVCVGGFGSVFFFQLGNNRESVMGEVRTVLNNSLHNLCGAANKVGM